MKTTTSRRHIFKLLAGVLCAPALPTIATELPAAEPVRKYVNLAMMRPAPDLPLLYRWMDDGKLVGPVFADLMEAFKDVEFTAFNNEMVLVNGEWVLDKNPKPKFVALINGRHVLVSRE